MEHRDLFEKYLTGSISAKEAAELKKLLQDDPEAKNAFIDYSLEFTLVADIAYAPANVNVTYYAGGLLFTVIRNWKIPVCC